MRRNIEFVYDVLAEINNFDHFSWALPVLKPEKTTRSINTEKHDRKINKK